MRARSGSAALAVVVSITLLSLACNNDDSGIVAGFTAVLREPGPKQVFLQRDQVVDESIILSVRVRATAGIASAELNLVYDPTQVVFLNDQAGTLLEKAGRTVTYDVAETVPGSLRISVSLPAGAPETVDAGTDSPALVLLGFSIAKRGSSSTVFQAGSQLRDEADAAIALVDFFGGTFTGS